MFKAFQYEYVWSNPNELSTPMGALCWATHEIMRGAAIGQVRYFMDMEHIPFVMGKLGITSDQVGEAGPEATEAVIDLLAAGTGDVGPVGSVNDEPNRPVEGASVGSDGDEPVSVDSGSESSVEHDAFDYERDPFFMDVYVDWMRAWDRLGGDGTEWENSVRAVNTPEVVAATRAGDGLPTAAQPYTDALFADVGELARGGYLFQFDDFNSFPWQLDNFDAFVEVAKYAQDCKRADIFYESDSESTAPIPENDTTTPTTEPITTPATTTPTMVPTVPSTTTPVDESSDN